MIDIPLIPFTFQVFFYFTMSFLFIMSEGIPVKPQNSAQLLFSLDFPLDIKRTTIHIYVVLDILDFNRQLT
jgi:hypothetical protein